MDGRHRKSSKRFGKNHAVPPDLTISVAYNIPTKLWHTLLQVTPSGGAGNYWT